MKQAHPDQGPAGLPNAPVRRRALLGTLVAAAALTACTESLDGFEASYSSGYGVSVQAGTATADALSFTVPKRVSPTSKEDLELRPRQAILKLDGYMPVPPIDVAESADRYTVRFRLPEDLVKEAKSSVTDRRPISGEVILPMDSVVISFTGLEHYVPTTSYVHVQLLPAYSGPLTSLAKSTGEALRSLYSAR